MIDFEIPTVTLEHGMPVRTQDVFAAFNTALNRVSQVASKFDYLIPSERERGRELFDTLAQMHLVYMALSDLVFDAYSVNDLVTTRD